MINWGAFLLSHPRFSTWGKPAFSYLSSIISSSVRILSIFLQRQLGYTVSPMEVHSLCYCAFCVIWTKAVCRYVTGLPLLCCLWIQFTMKWFGTKPKTTSNVRNGIFKVILDAHAAKEVQSHFKVMMQVL